MAKGEIAHHEQFHLWPNVFKSRLLLLRQYVSAGGKGLNTHGHLLTCLYFIMLYHTCFIYISKSLKESLKLIFMDYVSCR